jgi:hypothetical protein
MLEVEQGWYSFRASGIDKDGEMQIVTSWAKKALDVEDLRLQQKEFIHFCKTERDIANPKLTHTIREKDRDNEEYDQFYGD